MMISKAINEYARKRRAKVAIGLAKTNDMIDLSIKKASQVADIVVVGSHSSYAEYKVFQEEADVDHCIAEELANLINNQRVDAVVRGNIDYRYIDKVYMPAMSVTAIPRVAFIRDGGGNEFAMTPASIFEGNSMKNRADMAIRAARIVSEMGITVKVAIQQIYDFKGMGDAIDQIYDESQYVADSISNAGFDIGYLGYGIENVMAECNLLVPANGIIGNAIWRTITGIGGCKDFGDLGMIDSVFVDDSKYWNDYCDTIVFAAAMANRAK